VTDADLASAEQLCRRLGPANCWTGTGGSLASFALTMIRELKERNMKTTNGGTVTYTTGAVRSSDAEATRYDLISPIGLEAVARTCVEKHQQYVDMQCAATLLSECLSQTYKFLSGSRESAHLASAALAIMHAIQVLKHDTTE
jgi:hypothetical protein